MEGDREQRFPAHFDASSNGARFENMLCPVTLSPRSGQPHIFELRASNLAASGPTTPFQCESSVCSVRELLGGVYRGKAPKGQVNADLLAFIKG